MSSRFHPPRIAAVAPLTLALAAAFVQPVLASDDTFVLGTVTVSAKAESAPVSETVVAQSQLQEFNRETLGTAVSLVPGMSVSRNSRNEDIVYLRGFDVRQIPLFIDGIPAYVPYDGYVDFSRFTTFDLSQIQVAKGAASLLYGPNTLGGAINLVTRKPSKAFEGDIRVGFATGNAAKTSLNLGSNQGVWYLQAGASYTESDFYPLSSSYKVVSIPTTATGPGAAVRNVLEDGGNRENSYQTDRKYSLKLGLTPNSTDEYAIGYVSQHGTKGNPPYAGNAPGQVLNIGGSANSRFWQWPYWDVDSVYFVANVALGASHVLKARVYDDNYRNSLRAYTNGTYSTQLSNTSNFPSWYNDETRGMSMELVSGLFAGHDLHFAAHYKEDLHEDKGLALAKHYKDVTTSFAVEDAFDLTRDWRLRLGASHDKRDAKEVYQYPTGSTSANNWLAELTHALGAGNEFFTSLARKTRFPTIKDRYSARLGSALPNADLRPEHALNFEIGLKGSPWSGATGSAAFFYSRIEDLMQSVAIIPVNSCGVAATNCTQLQNVGDARHRGLEFSLTQSLAATVSAGANYTYLERENLTNSLIPLTDTPRNKLFAYLAWKPSDQWSYQATLDGETGRRVAYGSGNRAGYTTLAGYAVLGAKASYSPRNDMTVELGVSNVTDENYALADGYPMPGRMWFANAMYRF